MSSFAKRVLEAAEAAGRQVMFVDQPSQLAEAAVPPRATDSQGYFTVGYEVSGQGYVEEARVCRVRNGISANYIDPYMRRRDPDCMLIGDGNVTDKPTFETRFGIPFDQVREETFEWLSTQDVCYMFFYAGHRVHGMHAMAICPLNAAFFGLGLAMLQGICRRAEVHPEFAPKATVYVAPPFRHSHFQGKQVVVHNRREGMHELFSYNLYPGPSAKKGVYGMLLTLGEREVAPWTTAHCSTVQVVTPYDNVTTMMHEGASGGGKSEMLEVMHRETDGRLRLGTNLLTGEHRHVSIPRACELRPVTDDMALCHPALQVPHAREKKLVLTDAEDAWFLRVNHIQAYGTDPHLERLTTHPQAPLLFLNVDAVPGSTALIWEHIQDAPGQPCPNPRVVFPRDHYPGVVDGPVTVDIRSFGVRCPPCTAAHPTYGIIGMFHVVPPALAWLWRLVAPRGHGNPSIVDQQGMSSEGVGSYWPFATGRRVDQANILLRQILETPDTLFVLIPNQHIGAWEVGFAPQWIVREYLARRGKAQFKPEELREARCPLLGLHRETINVEGQLIGTWFFNVARQPEVGVEGYDRGAEILSTFFHDQIRKFLDDDLHPLGRKIIDGCLDHASVADYQAMIES